MMTPWQQAYEEAIPKGLMTPAIQESDARVEAKLRSVLSANDYFEVCDLIACNQALIEAEAFRLGFTWGLGKMNNCKCLT